MANFFIRRPIVAIVISILTVLFGVVGPPLLQFASGAPRIEVTLDGGEALMLLLTGLLFFVARLLAEAQRLADEHSQIV